MIKIISKADCGNSPKNIFLENFTVAYAKRDDHLLLDSVTDDIHWNIVGQKVIQGNDEFTVAVEQMKDDPVVEITIQHIVSHGKAGAVNGLMKMENGKTYAFCNVYEFGNAKGTSVREITSYLLEIS